MSNELDNQIARLTMTEGQVAALDIHSAQSELADSIIRTARTGRPVPRKGWSVGNRLAIPAILSVLALGYLLFPGVKAPPELPQGPAAPYSLAAIKVAESAPRYLVNLPGWRVRAADQFSSESGTVRFTNGHRELEIDWGRASDYQSRLEGNKVDSLSLDGSQVHIFDYGTHSGGPEYNGVWLSQDRTLTARGQFQSLAEYRRVIETLKIVDVNTWLDAMPDNVVKPTSRRQAVDAMLADIPIPPGLNVVALSSGEGVLERYHLGAKVAGEVFCGWMGIWHEARAKGDAAMVAAASDAMATSHDWAILKEMEEHGGFPQVLWQFADAMPDDGLVPAGRAMRLSEVDLKAAMGCELTQLPANGP